MLCDVCFFFNVMIILCVVWMFGVWRSLDKALNVKNVPLLVLFSKLPFICFHVYFLSFFNWLLSPLQLSLHQCLFFFHFRSAVCVSSVCVFFFPSVILFRTPNSKFTFFYIVAQNAWLSSVK